MITRTRPRYWPPLIFMFRTSTTWRTSRCRSRSSRPGSILKRKPALFCTSHRRRSTPKHDMVAASHVLCLSMPSRGSYPSAFSIGPRTALAVLELISVQPMREGLSAAIPTPWSEGLSGVATPIGRSPCVAGHCVGNPGAKAAHARNKG